MPHSDKLRNSMWVSRRAWMLAAAGTACRYGWHRERMRSSPRDGSLCPEGNEAHLQQPQQREQSMTARTKKIVAVRKEQKLMHLKQR